MQDFTYLPNISAPVEAAFDVAGFSVPDNIILPVGGDQTAPNVGSVTEILASSSTSRVYLLRNFTTSNLILFFGGNAAIWEADIRSPVIVTPSSGICVGEAFSKLACFGWCSTGGDVTVGVFS